MMKAILRLHGGAPDLLALLLPLFADLLFLIFGVQLLVAIHFLFGVPALEGEPVDPRL